MIEGTRRLRFVLGALGCAAVVGIGGALAAQSQEEDPFPHDDHENLFPVCTGCHEGVPLGNASRVYPEPDLCGQCHDGEEVDRVEWSGPSTRVDNVLFDHPEHARELEAAGDSTATCESCHAPAGGSRMAIGSEIQLDSCWQCHAHQATDHQVDADCAVCHLPLAESGFGLSAIEALDVPADHDVGTFVEELHGQAAEDETARCATCHTQDRCVSCHVDTQRSAIQAVPMAPPGMELPPMPANYPVPASHVDEGWFSAHGQQAPVGECSTCHTTDDCRSCHVSPAPELVTAMPRREDVVAPGVMLWPQAPENHAGSFFMEAHGTLAATEDQGCATCHEESYCTECHDGPVAGGYHPPDFVARHATEAFGQDDECAQCHNTASFCRSCHVESGFGADGRLGQGYHTAQPMWLLRHGQAARQNLESCASCHEQNQCLQCHGVLGSFKVSPHTRDFDAEAAWARNPGPCLACHVKNPLNGNLP